MVKYPPTIQPMIKYLFMLSVLLIVSCSELQEDLTHYMVEVHPSAWMDASSTDFHGEKVAAMGLQYCAKCHGSDYKGGENEVSCYTCHGGGPGGHPYGWMFDTSENYHGAAVIRVGWTSCAKCHGDDSQGGTSRKSCYACHDGPGGHPHDWLNPGSDRFHGIEIRNTGWNLLVCQTCHGEDYGGGMSGSSCLTCHVNTPEVCNTCHGSNVNIAPPQDTRGNTETTFLGVGAHQSHLTEGLLRSAIACSECHLVPESLHTAGHIDTEYPAEIRFGLLSTDNEALAPQWDGNNTCSNVYCHGEFPYGNHENDPQWIAVNTGQAQCGTCHPIPPKTPHPQVATCHLCHGIVDESRNIIDKTKHINGITDRRQ